MVDTANDSCPLHDMREPFVVGGPLRRRKLSDFERGLSVAASGAIAGALSRTLTAPFDRIRIVSAGKGVSLGSAIATVRKERTLAAFWRGNGINCAKIIPEAGIRMACADSFKRRVFAGKDCDLSLGQRFVAGAFGGICGQAAVYPLEVVRTQIATTAPGQCKSIVESAKYLYRKQGGRAFYRGIQPSLIGIIPYAGLEIAFFEGLKAAWEARRKGRRLHPVAVMATGAAASAGAQVLTYPLALLRVRMQAQAAATPPLSMRRTAAAILAADGMKGFYRGMAPNLLKMVPAAAIHWMAYDSLKRSMGCH